MAKKKHRDFIQDHIGAAYKKMDDGASTREVLAHVFSVLQRLGRAADSHELGASAVLAMDGRPRLEPLESMPSIDDVRRGQQFLICDGGHFFKAVVIGSNAWDKMLRYSGCDRRYSQDAFEGPVWEILASTSGTG